MFVEERKLKILDYINENSRAAVQELSDYLKVSEATVRRDLKELEQARLLNRTHGGAISLQGVNFEQPYNEKKDRLRREKAAIGRYAAELVEEGDTILIDSGTTTFQMVEHLKTFTRLTVITNSILIAQELQTETALDVMLTGGSIRRETQALVGPLAEQSLDMVRVDKAFIATNGVELAAGLTTPNVIEAATKAKMIKTAKEVILLADHSKVGKVTFARFAKLEDIHKCVIDAGVPDRAVRELTKLGIDVLVVQPEGE